VSFAQMIDSAWLVALDRAQKAGQMLAHLLMAAGAGDRPVTLLAHSMGARLAFHCLLELCRCNALGARRARPPPLWARQPRKAVCMSVCMIAPRPVHDELWPHMHPWHRARLPRGRAGTMEPAAPRPLEQAACSFGMHPTRRPWHAPDRAAAPARAPGIVEAVVLMGAPVGVRPERWAMARRAVAGRFVNAYSRRDWVLGLAYRGASGFVRRAGGLCPVDLPGIENINLSSMIVGHADYARKMREVLDIIAV